MHPLRKQSKRKTGLKEGRDIKGVCALPLPSCGGINVRWKEAMDKRVPEGSGRLEGEMPSLIESSCGEVGVRQWESQWWGLLGARGRRERRWTPGSKHRSWEKR